MLLAQSGLRATQFARLAGISYQTLEACLRGELPDVMSLYRIAKELDTSMEWLVSGEEEGLSEESLH